MNKLFLLPLMLLAGCSDLPSINPLPAITATVTVTATPETTKAAINPPPQTKEVIKTPPVAVPNIAGGDIYEICFEGKKGTKVNAGYVLISAAIARQRF